MWQFIVDIDCIWFDILVSDNLHVRFLVRSNMQYIYKQGKSEGFNSCDRPSNITLKWTQIVDFFAHVTLKFDRWPVKNNRAHLLCYLKLCASFRKHMWIQTGVTVRKRLYWVLTSVTLTFDLWPWPLAWTSLLSMVITLKISWWSDDRNIVKKCVTDRLADRRTDGRTDRRTERCVLRAAWSQLNGQIFAYNDECTKYLEKCLFYRRDNGTREWLHIHEPI